MRAAIILAAMLVAIAGCRSHKEADTCLAKTTQTQTTEMTQSRTDSRAEAQTESAESADSIAWTMTADSIVQTKADGMRIVLYRVCRTRTAYKPTATAKATTAVQQTDTTSAVVAEQSHRHTAAQTHSESSRGGRPWWPLVVAVLSAVGLIYYARHTTRAQDKDTSQGTR